jgi:pre-rRNA-processing protein TSR3
LENNPQQRVPRIFTLELRQDDPAKCTSAKMRKFGFARSISRSGIPSESIVLNPTAESTLIPTDRDQASRHGLTVIDCSWNLSAGIFDQRFRGEQRKLPILLAGNPTNYAKQGRLSSIEAVAGALYILNFKELAGRLLSLYKWGNTFLTLNQDLLEEYSKAKDAGEIKRTELEFFPTV